MPVQEEIRIKVAWKGREADIGLERLREEFKKLEARTKGTNGALGGMQGHLSGMLARLGPLGPAIAGAFGVATVKAIFDTSHEMAKLAAQSEITEEVFGRLAVRAGSTGPAELEKLRAAVGGTLSELELMQKVGAAVDAGLSFDQSRTALEFLRRYSLAFGKDFNQLTSTIFTGLQRGSTLMLDDAGIIIDASSDIYKGLSEIEKKSRLVGDAIKIMGEKMKTLPEIQDNAITSSDALSVSYQNLGIEVGELIAAPFDVVLGTWKGAVDLLTESVRGLNESLSGREWGNQRNVISESDLEKMERVAKIVFGTEPRSAGEDLAQGIRKALDALKLNKKTRRHWRRLINCPAGFTRPRTPRPHPNSPAVAGRPSGRN